jgi:hypothetical protein
MAMVIGRWRRLTTTAAQHAFPPDEEIEFEDEFVLCHRMRLRNA